MKNLLSKTVISLLVLCMLAFATPDRDDIKHLVIIKFKAGTAQGQIDELGNAFFSLKDKIPGITAFESGVNNSPENLNKEFTHIYSITFRDVASRDSYLIHPEHVKFGEYAGKLGIIEDVFVLDYKPY
jgi:hypothetical protein